MKKAVIFGITGQDGSLLADFLLKKHYNVIGVSRRTSSPTDWRIKELGLYSNDNFTICSGDITDQNSVDAIINATKPNEVYNLAAQSFVGVSWSQSELTMDITGLGPMRIFEAVRKFAPEAKVYQASSSEMFGQTGMNQILNERSTFRPKSPYGVAKCAAHYMADVYRKSYDLFISCGILFNHEGPYRGEEFVSRKISKSIAEIKLGKRKIFNLGNTFAKRDWGNAQDYVEAMYLMLQQKKPDDFVISTGISYSISDFVSLALKSAGLDGEWSDYVITDINMVRPSDVFCLCGDYSKANKELGWEPKTSFEQMVFEMVQKDIERLNGS